MHPVRLRRGMVALTSLFAVVTFAPAGAAAYRADIVTSIATSGAT